VAGVEPVNDPRDRREALARLAAAGDRRALDDLLAAVRPDVLRQCGRMLPHPMDAEEACQDVLLAVARGIGTFEGRARFSTWLHRVTANASLDTYRRLKRRAAGMSAEVPPDVAAAARTSVLAGTRIDVLDALEQVDARVAEPVVLRDLLGLDYAEIARALDVPEGTVKSRIHEGRRSLQRLLGH
jgi:RNA polymerase sigma-70 factor (ECF subfamily)